MGWTTTSNSWTDARIEWLKELWVTGASGTAIARMMGGGLTRNAVIAKVHRLKLPQRSSDVKRINQKSATPRGAALRGYVQPKVAAPSKPRPVVPTRTWVPAEPVVEALEVAGLCSIVTIGAHQCRWPIGDPQEPTFTLCGRKADRTYCEAHAHRAYDHAANARVRKTRGPPAESRRRYA